MSNEHLNSLARRVEDDAFFLGCPLQRYATSERMSDQQLADALGLATDQLALLRLCRAPAGEPGQFRKGINEISTRFHVDADVLADAVRRGQAIMALARPGKRSAGTLAAARDGERETDVGRERGTE